MYACKCVGVAANIYTAHIYIYIYIRVIYIYIYIYMCMYINM